MKKITLLVFLLIGFFATAQETLILTEDTVINQSESYNIVRTNGFNLTVNGSLNVISFILLNKGNQSDGGSVHTTDDLIVSGNVFFQDDNGTIRSNTGISVGGDTNGKGTFIYCTFYQSPVIGNDVTVIQNCTLSLPEFVQNLKIGEPYIIYNSLGQMWRS
jgi:hypothetical protein